MKTGPSAAQNKTPSNRGDTKRSAFGTLVTKDYIENAWAKKKAAQSWGS